MLKARWQRLCFSLAPPFVCITLELDIKPATVISWINQNNLIPCVLDGDLIAEDVTIKVVETVANVVHEC